MLEMGRHIYEFWLNNWYTNISWTVTVFLIIMIMISVPLIGYQLYSQCGNLCKDPTNTFYSNSGTATEPSWEDSEDPAMMT